MMNEVGWLIVGAGDIARKRIIPAIEADNRNRLTAVCDLSPERAQAVSEPRDIPAYTDLATALEDPGVDAVYLSTPVFLHVPQGIECLAAGKHVLVEKPVALNYKEARKLAAAAAQSETKCGVAYFRRCSRKFAMAREMLKNEEFGRLVLIRMAYFSWFNPNADDPKYWRVIPERSGGGPVSDMGAHMFDVLIGLCGVPRTVFARAKTLVHSYAVEDSAAAVLTMRDGAQVTASFHWNSRTWSHEFEIIGTEAKLKWHPYDSDSVLKTVGREITEVATPNPTNVHAPLLHDFTSAILEDRPPAVTAAEAAETNLIMDALYHSAREQREVVVDDLIQPDRSAISRKDSR